MPDAPRDDERLSTKNFDNPFSVRFIENHVHPSRDQEQQFVAVGVALARMRSIGGHERGTDVVAVDPGRRTVGPLKYRAVRSPNGPQAACPPRELVILPQMAEGPLSCVFAVSAGLLLACRDDRI